MKAQLDSGDLDGARNAEGAVDALRSGGRYRAAIEASKLLFDRPETTLEDHIAFAEALRGRI